MTAPRRGHSMVTTLLWLALIACLAFGLAGLTISHLSTLKYQDNRQEARQLARSVVSTAIARLMQDTNLGKPSRPSGLIEVRLAGTREDAVGQLSFEKTYGIPYSTNNLEETTATVGSEGRAVPKSSVYLVGLGRSGGVVQRVQAVLAVPPFPYAVAASGSVEARGGLVVGSLPAIPDGPIPDSATFLPADLLANDTGQQSVFLGADTEITGDVRAVGDIVLDPAAPVGSIQVKGQLRSQSSPEKIPTVELSRYDPRVNGSLYTPLTRDLYSEGQTKLSGANRREGPMHVTQGLFLDGATLFVHGDLLVEGGLSGKGVLAVDGNVTLRGQSDFNSSNGVAVLASRDFQLSGSDPAGSYFQGLVYTEGSFAADHVTLIGSLIAAGDPRPVTLHDARVLRSPPPPPGPVATGSPAPSPTATPSEWTESTNWPADSNPQPGTPGHAVFRLTCAADGQCHLHVSIPEDPQAALDLTFHKDNFQPFYGTDARIYDFCRQYGYNDGDSINVTGVLTTLDKALHPVGTPGGSGGSTGGTPPAAVSLIDPSAFLKLNERIRLVMWKEE